MSVVTTSATTSMPTPRFSVFKRTRDEEEDTQVEELAMANSMMLLSRVGQNTREFECKTCNRKFSSFQALGGHRASHKRPKFDEGSRDGVRSPVKSSSKTHECSICGMEFSVGQALGGHMRRHRREGSDTPMRETSTSTPIMAAQGVMNKSVDSGVDSGSTSISFLDLGFIPFQNLRNKIKTPPILIQFF